jgi:prolyl-tRNA editing enzyme YbaK/EbsC (Cys-tRNA(Pro) deacylase)
MEYGGVTAFGVPENVPMYVDVAVVACGFDQVVMGGGNRSSKVLIAPEELRKCGRIEIVEGLAKTA